MFRIAFLICWRLRRPTFVETQSLDHTSRVVSTQIIRFFAPTKVLISSA